DTENIIKIVAMSRGRSDEKYALMEYGGQDLHHFTEENGVFKDENLKKTFFQAVKGVSTLFRAGYLHHDIKPDNILINDEGVVKLCDFGLAEKMPGKEKKRFGTVLYMPLEKLYKLETYPNDKVDSWSLGCTFAEMRLGYPVIDDFSAGLLWNRYLNVNAAEEKLEVLRESTYLQLLEKEGEQAAELFNALTELDPRQRLSPTEALKHPYFASCYS
ncbi:protein kinase, partial [Endozoicomonas sp. SESOKO1]|uniref:protein kinase domain-containing protein n=1 Tax=Endozoicomonas sp. SESOKO1 TaxID=2828742 RepID=UPI00214822B6